MSSESIGVKNRGTMIHCFSHSTGGNSSRAERITGKRGKLVEKGYLYKVLNNRVYVGQAVHKGTSYPGEHKAIISQELWDECCD